MAKSKTKTNQKYDPAIAHEPAERYGAECASGAMAARAFLMEMIADQSFSQLAIKAREIIEAGKFSGYEVGFFGEIARACAGQQPLPSDHYLFHAGKFPINDTAALETGGN